ncbi:General secretion pathway protein K [Rosistilla ulvae]|uniref:General secretion pathway protein K n=1 Tax=Rosistilla ulvae TaxID=1930277 RepID=A0A517M4U4_9BACT|nr:type II secretion system protein GspK [Rosistilla ulvae]QDS89886.1 General secretion pathway protein K [Rosistilla ulvae]
MAQANNVRCPVDRDETTTTKQCVPRRARRGIFLLIALVVIAVSTMAAYSFTDLMLAYDESTILSGRKTQADMLVESGTELARLMLAQSPTGREEMGGVDNNPAMFQAINVVPDLDPQRRGNVTVIAPSIDAMGEFSGIRYGLQNESARLNLNVLTVIEENYTVGDEALQAAADLGLADTDQAVVSDNIARELLMSLPNMTEDVADSILDWLDEDDEQRDFGAEYDYYNALPTPYGPKNGPLDSVEELLLVRGVTPELLFGADTNRNGIIDPIEQTYITTGDQSTASLGWSAFLTVYSREGNKTADGADRVDVNAEDLEQLQADLTDVLGNEDWASFIVAYRVAGQSGATASTGGDSDAAEAVSQASSGQAWSSSVLSTLDLSEGKVEVSQLLDLVGATVVVGEGNDQAVYQSPFANEPLSMATYMPYLMGLLTSKDYDSMPGRINLNECPAELIYGLPILEEETALALVEARGEQSESENRRFETWPLVEGILTLEQMRQLLPLVTAGGDVFRAQVVGYFEGANQSARVEVVIDATTINPDIVYWRSLSHLGRGFDVGTLGVRGEDGMQTLSIAE